MLQKIDFRKEENQFKPKALKKQHKKVNILQIMTFLIFCPLTATALGARKGQENSNSLFLEDFWYEFSKLYLHQIFWSNASKRAQLACKTNPNISFKRHKYGQIYRRHDRSLCNRQQIWTYHRLYFTFVSWWNSWHPI